MSRSDKEYGKFQRRCCVTQRKNKILTASAGCAEDIAAVSALPENWTPKTAGPILVNFLKENEQRHNNTLNDIYKEAKVINKTIDSNIRRLAEDLLCYIKQNQLDMGCVVENIDAKYDPLCSELHIQALDCINQLHSQRINDISTFKLEAMSLEEQRSDKIRTLLQTQFQRLVSIGHKPPSYLLHEFDQRTYEINQQLLSNNRAYIELEAQLQSQCDESVVRVKSNLNQLCLGVAIQGHRHSIYPWQRDDKSSIRRSVSTSMNIKRTASETSIGHMIDEVGEFDECVSLLVQAYRTAVMKVFSGFSGKLSDLHSHLGCYGCIELEPYLEESADVQRMIEKILRRTSVNMQKDNPNFPELVKSTQFDALKMQKSLFSLGERLRDTYTILHDSGHLWDAHMVRAALAQQLTVTCVEDLFTSHDTFQLANEVNFNIVLEQLRSASDPDKLQQYYESIMIMLERTADIYKQHNELELGKLKDFMNFPEQLTNVLMSEFYCFFEKFPRTSSPIAGCGMSLLSVNSPRLEINTLRMPLPRAIIQTELQETYLLNWRNGFLETFKNNLCLVPDELKDYAKIWVDEKIRSLSMRHCLKFVSHSVRNERIKAARDNRLAELKYHDTRLESHLNAVFDLVNILPSSAAEYLSLDTPELYPFCEWVDRIHVNIESLLVQDPIDYETKKLKMCSYAPRLKKHRLEFEKSLDAAIDCGKRQLENRVQEARISNVRFMSQLKLFSEGGRYSAQEAIRTCTALVKAADALELCLTKAIEALKQRRSQILMLADQKLSPLNKIVDEFAKKNVKTGVIDKRKPATGKKK